MIQFRKTGDAFVFDLGSAQGTFINKKPVRPKVKNPSHILQCV